MSKNALISERIKILEGKLGNSGNILGKDAGIGNGTVGGWTDNQIEKPTAAVEKFLRYYGISLEWWKTGKGDVFITSVQKQPLITGEPLRDPYQEMYDKFLGTGSQYLVVHRDFLKEHRFISVEQLEMNAKELDDRAKQLKTLTDIISGFASKPINIQLPNVEKT